MLLVWHVLYNISGNDDWLITPEIKLDQEEVAMFSFWAHSYSQDYPEDFNVKLSTEGTDTSNFNIIFYFKSHNHRSA